LNEAWRAELMRVLALLEERHGVGVRGDELPRWLEERLSLAVQTLLSAHQLELEALYGVLLREPQLLVELANALRVGETRFYRDAPQWEALRRQVLPGLWARRNPASRLLALSAGCSTGEEAWTIAMLLAEASGKSPGAVAGFRVLGVDRSEPALSIARSATYDQGSLASLPRELSQRFVTLGMDGSSGIVPALRSVVGFQCRDLAQGLPPGRYDLIVCKNVLIYFGDEAQQRLARTLLRSLSHDGLLVVARSEVPILRGLGAAAREIAPNVVAFTGPG